MRDPRLTDAAVPTGEFVLVKIPTSIWRGISRLYKSRIPAPSVRFRGHVESLFVSSAAPGLYRSSAAVRGEIWTVASGVNASEPRPAGIVQDDLFGSTQSVVVAPMASAGWSMHPCCVFIFRVCAMRFGPRTGQRRDGRHALFGTAIERSSAESNATVDARVVNVVRARPHRRREEFGFSALKGADSPAVVRRSSRRCAR